MTEDGVSFIEMARTLLNIKDRILSRVSLAKGCWEWEGYVDKNGYSQICVGSRTDGTRKNTQAHRVSYEAFVGPIANGMQIDHLCRNRKCVNPKHLEQVTSTENLRRGNPLWKQELARTHCPKGHEYSKANTYIRKSGGRMCKECGRERNRFYGKLRREMAVSL